MPNFTKHQRLCYEFLIGILTLYFIIIERNFLIPCYIIGFILGTNVITPDLDTASTPYNNHKSLWYIYKKLSKHRGKSHNIFLGLMSKLIYLTALLVALIYIYGLFLDDKMLLGKTIEKFLELLKMYYIYIIYTLAGLFTANTSHIIQDRFYKKSK